MFYYLTLFPAGLVNLRLNHLAYAGEWGTVGSVSLSLASASFPFLFFPVECILG